MNRTGVRPLVIILPLLALSLGIFSQKGGGTKEPEELYWDAEFRSALRGLEVPEKKDLSLEERLLRAECLARTEQGAAAGEVMGELLAATPGNVPPSLKSRISATAGIVLFSLGRMDEARSRIRSALSEEPASERALLAMIFLALHDRNSAEAVLRYEELARLRPDRAGSYLLYLVGLEVYTAARDPRGMARLYERRAVAEKKNRAYAEGLKANARFITNSLKDGFFSVAGSSPENVIPFTPDPRDRQPSVFSLEIKGASFRLILDSGNRAGWTVHNPELLELLKSRRGGRILSEIGTQAGILEGYSIFTPKLELGSVTVLGLAGVFVPKPHPDFYDANLNPAFIGNRIVTLDYVEKKAIIRTREEFEKNLLSLPPGRAERFAWMGFGHAFVRAEIQNTPALALIETGAEDISLRLDFARRLGLPLAESKRYLATGEAVTYHTAPVRLSLGTFLFDRNSAEAWPLTGLSHPISGLVPDVVIGPRALAGIHILSFDPFENRIVLEKPPAHVSAVTDPLNDRKARE